MFGNTVKVAVIGLCTLMVVAGLTVPALATEGPAPSVDENGTLPGTTNPDYDRAYITVNLGVLGDTFGILCDLPDGYVEYDVAVSNDDPLDATDSANYNFHASGDIGDAFPDSDVCLGGAVGPFAPTSGATRWHVMAVDYVFNGCESAADRCIAPLQNMVFADDPADAADEWEGLDDVGLFDSGDSAGLVTADPLDSTFNFRVSGLARVQASYDIPNPNAGVETCVVGGGSQVDVCEEEMATIGYTSNFMTMGFCGEATTDLATIAHADAAHAASPIDTGVQVFWDSPVFMLFDCISGPSLIAPTYNTVKNTVNTFTCNPGDMIPDTVCIFDFPAGAGACLGFFTPETAADADADDATASATRVAIAGIIGETGWDYAEGVCDTVSVNDNWVFGTGTILTIRTPPLPPEADPVIDAINDVLDTVDVCADFSFDGHSCHSHGN